MRKVLDHTLEALCAFFLATMTVVVTLQVWVRFLSGYANREGGAFVSFFKMLSVKYFHVESFYWTDELSGYLLVWLSVLGASLAVREKLHLGVDILVRKLSERTQERLAQFALLGTITFSLVVMCYGGWSLVRAQIAGGQTSPTLGIHMAWVYTVIPLGGFFNTLYALELLLNRRSATLEKSYDV